MEKTQTELNNAIEIFAKYGIKARLNADNLIVISHYEQPKEKTFEELGINENELIKNVVACEGRFDLRKSKITEFPLVVAREIRMYEDNEIIQMPNLKVVGFMIANKKIKKLPKVKSIAFINLEGSLIKSLPKLKEVGVLISQNSSLKELPSLVQAKKLCLIDSPIENLKELEQVDEFFLCSSDEENKIQLNSLPKLEKVEKMFVANCELKTLPNLKEAKKIALYNCKIKSIKQKVCFEVEVEKHITDEQLSEKFDSFTDWYNSELITKSMDLLGNIVSHIKS